MSEPARNPPWLLPTLVALVALTYQPVWQGGLLWDDDHHLTAAALQSLHGLWRIWTDLGATQQYYPLAHSAFWLAHRLWGADPTGYHLLNIGLHALSAYLLAVLLCRLRVPGASVAAVLFAVHPINVESVAWISELKNTLSTVAYLAAALAYLRFADTRRRGHYALALLLFFCALLSKTVTATLPVSVLVVLWWQKGRLTWRRDVAPLVPFVAAGIAAGLGTAFVERHFVIGGQEGDFHLSLVERLLVAGRAVWFYVGKIAWPANLAFVYPRWRLDAAAVAPYLFPAAVVAVATALWAVRGRSRAPFAVFLLVCVSLAPALGFFDVFPFRYSFVADHFAYLVGLPAMACAGAALAWAAGRTGLVPARAAVVAAIVAGAPLALVAHAHARDFAGAETLYRATIARNPDAWMAHNNLGLLMMADGRVQEGREQMLEALRLRPDALETELNAARVLIEEGRLDEATALLGDAIRRAPGLADAHSNLGVALLRAGHAAEATVEFEAALRLAPGHLQARANLAAAHQQLGVVDAQAGRMADALAHFETAVRDAPDDAAIRYNLGTAYLATGRPREAVIQLEEALRLNPGLTEARANLDAARRAARLSTSTGFQATPAAASPSA